MHLSWPLAASLPSTAATGAPRPEQRGREAPATERTRNALQNARAHAPYRSHDPEYSALVQSVT